MISCRLEDLKQRCRERGYTLDEVRPCIVSQDGDEIIVNETHAAYPLARPGLGDMVAKALDSVGITKKRVEAVVGRPCACRKRQDALNVLGAKYLGIGTASETTPAP